MSRCIYTHPKYEDGRCPRDAIRGWTTCPAHKSAGRTSKAPRGVRRESPRGIETREVRGMIGVWVDGEPVGRIRETGGKFAGYTNRRAPGSAHVGTFTSIEEAAQAVAKEHDVR